MNNCQMKSSLDDPERWLVEAMSKLRFGRVEGLQCPHATGDRKLIKRRHANLALRVVEQEFVGVLGFGIGWPELMQMVESREQQWR